MARSIRVVGNGVLWLAVGVACSTVATCGQKGPLELPDDDATVARFAHAANITERGVLSGPCSVDHGICDHALRA